MKHNIYAAKLALLDCVLLMELTGRQTAGDYFSVFDGSICNLDDLQAEAESIKHTRLLHQVHCYNLFIAYWRGNLEAAEEYSRLASTMHPASKIPAIQLIYATFFRGLVLFQMHREVGGEQRLKDGQDAMHLIGKWAQLSPNSMAVFENKWHLLKAEHAFSVQDHDHALEMYRTSIETSRDRGNIHELALSYELLGNYYKKQRRVDADVNECYKNAFEFYSQWGAVAVARRLLIKHNLEMDSDIDRELHAGTLKHSRQRA